MERSATRYLNFTKKAIESLPIPDSGRSVIYDEQKEGLGVRIDANGRRSFFWFKKVLGRPMFRSIGVVADVSIEEARDTADEWNGALAEWKRHGYEGENPFERNEEPTFGELLEDYIERHLKTHAKNPGRAESEIRYAINTHVSSWKNRKLSTIRRPDMAKIHHEIGQDRKYAADRLRDIVRAMFNFAQKQGQFSGDNPGKIDSYHHEGRTRFLQPQELARLFQALRSAPADLRDFVNLSLWTGARKSDVLAMRWEQLSLTDNRWEIPSPKSRNPYAVALTPEAIQILKQRRQRLVDSPWVFPSRAKKPAALSGLVEEPAAKAETGHLVNVKRGWKALLDKANITDLRIHDLRRTLGSWQAATGASLPIIGKSLGHSTAQATQVYARLDLDPVRESVMAATRAMIAAAAKNKTRKRKALSPAVGAA